MGKHTATPWSWWTSNSHARLTGADGRDGGVISASISSDGMAVVNVSPADAAFIVRACNAHDQLVAALKKAVALAEIASDWALDEVEIDGEMVDVLDLGKEFAAALAAAEA